MKNEASMRVSVMVCTYNRAHSLKDTLDSIAAQQLSAGWEMEVLVVDNNSTDNTRAVCDAFAAKAAFTVRYIREENQGVAFARNRALTEAAGKYALFIDDDALAAEGWIQALIDSFEATGADMTGGKIDPYWLLEKPEWLDKALLGPVIRLDYGKKRARIKHPAQTFLTANLGFRKESIAKYGLFDTSLGRCKDRWVGGEDYELCSRWWNRGAAVYYEPAALVLHKVEPERMTPEFYKRWFRDIGYTQGHQLAWKPHYRWSIVPAWRWGLILKTFMLYAGTKAGAGGRIKRLQSEIWWSFQKSFLHERYEHWKAAWFGNKEAVCPFSKAR